MGIPCFLLAPTSQANAGLRRYSTASKCSGNEFWHTAETPIGVIEVAFDAEHVARPKVPTFETDERWPTTCSCGYAFTEDDERQVNTELIYVAGDGREMTLREAPAGAMWDAPWMDGFSNVNGSGPCWVIKLPPGVGVGHEWMPGQESSNCPRKGEDHDCWCVHGDAPMLTVDKEPEPGRTTCVAGAGSIATGDWHGFLRNGELVSV